MEPLSGPITHSKYAQALSGIVSKNKMSQAGPPLNMTELAQAIMDDHPSEFANEVFDKETRQLLKYRKLIMHPKHCKVGCAHLQTNLDDLHKESEAD
jgi:hypothetical protein